jgi:tRNA threonylcarbamoyladenosine biosynthesis protein TsaB
VALITLHPDIYLNKTDIILAVETATDNCSVALMSSDETVFEYDVLGKGVHSEAVFTGIRDVLRQSGAGQQDVTLVLLSAGPGSYTGLRVGYSAVKGFLFGHSARLFTTNTLLSGALAVSNQNPGYQRIHVVLDARRKHFIHQSFRKGGSTIIPLDMPAIIPIAGLETRLADGDLLVGSGLERIDFPLPDRIKLIRDCMFRARFLFDIWRMNLLHPELEAALEEDPGTAEPLYLTTGV